MNFCFRFRFPFFLFFLCFEQVSKFNWPGLGTERATGTTWLAVMWLPVLFYLPRHCMAGGHADPWVIRHRHHMAGGHVAPCFALPP